MSLPQIAGSSLCRARWAWKPKASICGELSAIGAHGTDLGGRNAVLDGLDHQADGGVDEVGAAGDLHRVGLEPEKYLRRRAQLGRDADAGFQLGGSYDRVDVSDADQVASSLAAAVGHHGRLDVVINNAGVPEPDSGLAELAAPDFSAVLAVNLIGVANGLRHASAHMRDGGSIINTASLAARIGFPGYGAYAASKAGVVSLTQTAAIEVAARGIRVNAVCPGTVRTPMAPDGDPENTLCEIVAPAGRVAEVDDLVGVYHFLAADESRYITGQSLVVDGGWSAGGRPRLPASGWRRSSSRRCSGV